MTSGAASPYHRNLAAGGWRKLGLVEQMANVGSEVERAIRAHETGRTSRFGPALDRALELFDLTATDPRWRGPRRREILRAREEFCRLFFDPEVPGDSADGLRRYFFHFALRAQEARHRGAGRRRVRESSPPQQGASAP